MPRLFGADGPALAAHHLQFGSLPRISTTELISLLDAARLSGRGGAGFPTGRKIASVNGAKPIVVANGAEGEPLSAKDAVLLRRAPHLVLDGLQLAAEAVTADKVYVYLPAHATAAVTYALTERRRAGIDRRKTVVVEAPDMFVAGEESAVVRRIEGGPALPRDRTVVTSVSGVHGRPTLVNNVETLAHIALIARYGSDWFTSVGGHADPGSMLVTLSARGQAGRRRGADGCSPESTSSNEPARPIPRPCARSSSVAITADGFTPARLAALQCRESASFMHWGATSAGSRIRRESSPTSPTRARVNAGPVASASHAWHICSADSQPTAQTTPA